MKSLIPLLLIFSSCSLFSPSLQSQLEPLQITRVQGDTSCSFCSFCLK